MDANEDYYLQKGVNGVYAFMTNRLLTVAETQLFIRQAADVWNDAERNAFIDFIAANPEEGDMIPDTGGIRKYGGVVRVQVNAAACGLFISTTIRRCRFIC